MQRQYSVQHSWRKQLVSDRLLSGFLCNTQHLSKNLEKFSSKWSTTSLIALKRSLVLASVPEIHWEKVNTLFTMWEKSNENYDLAKWYVTQILTDAPNLKVAQQTLPEIYWPHIQGVEFTGKKTIEEIFSKSCYTLFEEIQINNLLLGILNK